MDKEFAAMCIPLISMGLRCAECAGCTLIFRKYSILKYESRVGLSGATLFLFYILIYLTM